MLSQFIELAIDKLKKDVSLIQDSGYGAKKDYVNLFKNIFTTDLKEKINSFHKKELRIVINNGVKQVHKYYITADILRRDMLNYDIMNNLCIGKLF
jgi:hypothetical protein